MRGYDIRWRGVATNGRTVEECYESFKSIRPPDDTCERGDFTHFTFVVVDDQCICGKLWQCIVACDAPDVDEEPEEIKLKHYRLPLEQGIGCLYELEDLTCHPSEAQNQSRKMILMQPPPTVVFAGFTEDKRPTFKSATRAEARMNKRNIILQRKRN